MSEIDSWKKLADTKINSQNKKFNSVFFLLIISLLINGYLLFNLRGINSKLSELDNITSKVTKIEADIKNLQNSVSFIGNRSFRHITQNHP